MNKKLTLKDVRDIFIELEEKYAVFSLEYKDVYYWKLIRFELFEYIVKKLSILDEGHPMSRKDKFKRLVSLIKYSGLNLFMRKNIHKSDVLILTHGRKVKHKNEYLDIYLYDIVNSLKEKDSDIFIIDRPDHYGNHYRHDNDMIYFERFGHVVRQGLYRFSPYRVDNVETKQILNNIENELKRMIDVNVDLIELVNKRIFRFKFEKKYFDKLLFTINPSKIILVVSYGKEELIASARERGIEVIEVQHGVISSYHMGYYFPFEHSIPYFPDELILFGDYWKESIRFPLNSRRTKKSFSLMKSSYNSIVINESKMNRILFISQGSIGVHLAKIAADFANKNSVECYYKLHPSEYSNWRSKYSELAECEINGRIKVISNENSIYELFNLCKYVVGVYSTAIYESLMYECKTFVVNLEGYQYMEYLIEMNYVKLLREDFSFNDIYDFQGKELKNKEYFYM
jgi:hypothetical protein